MTENVIMLQNINAEQTHNNSNNRKQFSANID